MNQLADGNIAPLLTLKRDVRAAPDLETLATVITNRSSQLIDFMQAVLLTGRSSTTMRVQATSDIAFVDASAPLLNWVEKTCKRHSSDMEGRAVFTPTPDETQSVIDLVPPFVLFVPLRAPRFGLTGCLVLTRAEKFSDADIVLISHLADTFAHALAGFVRRRLTHALASSVRTTRRRLIIAVCILLLGIFPVRISALAPAEIAAAQPRLVTAPLDGVVDEITITPNARVTPGTLLVRLVSIDLKNNYDLATQAFRVAEAELLRTRQLAFSNVQDKSRIAQLQANMELRRAEMAYAQQRLKQEDIRADREGIAIVSDPVKWAGRPVLTGEKILEIADPDKVEILFDLPVKDAITLAQDAEVDVFLDIDPLWGYWTRQFQAFLMLRPLPPQVLHHTERGLALRHRHTHRASG